MSRVTSRKLNRFFIEIKNVFADKSIYGNKFISIGRKTNSTVGSYSTVVCSGSGEASGNSSAVVGGYSNTASGSNSAIYGGYSNTASSNSSAVVGGYSNTASSGSSAVIGGNNNTASYGNSVIVGGSNNKTENFNSAVVGGTGNTASNESSAVVGGTGNTASGAYSAVIGGNNNTALDFQLVTGHYNDTSMAAANSSYSGTGTGTAFAVGNGTEHIRSNAIRFDYDGKMWCKSSYSSTGADYAELFEWEDGNSNNEDRRGYFVTMISNKIKKANPGDWILGIVSANPCILGNSDMEWQGQFLRDEFGAFIIEDTIVTETRQQPKLDEDGNPVYEEVPIVDGAGNQLFDKYGKPAFTLQPVFEDVEVEVPCQFYKVNPDYDPTQEYVDRISRPEWDAIGMMGVLSVYDDGTCEVDGFCTVADGGIATASTYGYRVIERVTDNIVKVVINAESSNMILALMDKIALLEQQLQKDA